MIGTEPSPPSARPQQHPDGRSPVRRAARAATVLLAVAVLMVSIGGFVLVRYYDGRILRLHLSLGKDRPAAAANGAENILIAGSDTRSGAGDGGSAAAAATPGARSDSILLVHLSKGSRATVISFPRDTIVPIPSYTLNGVTHPSQTTLINAAFNSGGPALLIRTVEGLSGIRVDRYLQVDFGGFKDLSNAVGGVDVCLKASTFREYVAEDGKYSTNINDPMSGFVGRVGMNHIQGDNALAFVRQRHGLASSDLGRIQRQQLFISALVKKAISASLITDPVKLKDLLDAATTSLEVYNANINALRTLATRLTSAGQVEFATIPTSPDGAHLTYDPATLAAFFAKITADGASPAPTRKPSSIQVNNASGVSGVAGRIATELKGKGFTVGGTGNATVGARGVPEIRYAPGAEPAARSVAAVLAGARLVPDSSLSGDNVVVVVHSSSTSVTGAGTSGAATGSTAAGSGGSPSAGTSSGGTTAAATPAPAAAAAPNCIY